MKMGKSGKYLTTLFANYLKNCSITGSSPCAFLDYFGKSPSTRFSKTTSAGWNKSVQLDRICGNEGDQTIFQRNKTNFSIYNQWNNSSSIIQNLQKNTILLSHQYRNFVTLTTPSALCLQLPLYNRTRSKICLFHVLRTSYGIQTGSGEVDSSQASGTPVGQDSAKIWSRPGTATIPPGEGGVEVIYFRGLPQITVPLPSRREKCRFILKPLTNSVGDLLHMIQNEDKGIDRITALSQDGVRIAASNTVEMLMEQNFNLLINDTVYHVSTPPQEKPSPEELARLSSVRNLVGQLYAALNVDEHQLRQEREMMSELERLSLELEPLEAKKIELSHISGKKTNILTWVGLGLMSVQFGILARLTWWEYSWDIMEPVTYFVTYGTAMLAYAYFVITKQDYVLPEVRDRQYLVTFHKNARKIGLDVGKYNELRTKISKIEHDLQRLRDPLALHLPLKTRLVHLTDLQRSNSDSPVQGIISKAQQKFQQILQKAQSSSSSTS